MTMESGEMYQIKINLNQGPLLMNQKVCSLTQSRLDLDNLLNERKASVEIIDKKNSRGIPAGTKINYSSYRILIQKSLFKLIAHSHLIHPYQITKQVLKVIRSNAPFIILYDKFEIRVLNFKCEIG